MLHTNNKSREKKENEERLVGGNLSIFERTSRALAAQSFLTDLPWWWTHHPSNYVTIDALSHQLELVITTATAGKMTQGTSGTTPTVTLDSAQLKCRMVHVEDDERDYHISRCLSGAGIVMPFRDFETQYDNIIAGGGTSFDISLTNLRGPCSDFRFSVQLNDYVTNDGTTDNQPFTYLPVRSWSVTAAGLTIFDSMTDAENRDLLTPSQHSGSDGEYWYGHSSALDAEDFNNSTGHENWGGLTQPKLTVVFASDPGQCVLHVVCTSPNTIQESKGDIMKNFQ